MRRTGMLGAVVVAGVGIGAAAWLDTPGDSGGRGRAVVGAATAEHRATGQTQPQAVTPRALRLVVVRRSLLPRPVQDAAIAAADATHVLLLGGLNAADSSTDTVFVAGADGGRPLGRLPSALHDSAATRLGSSIYLFGGGTATSQLDQIVRVDAAGRAFVVGRLPAPSSDQAAAVIGGTAYVVGGFTGTRWLDSIVAWRPGTQPRVVAHLPSPLRYAAVTALAHRLVIAGGSLPSGAASDSVLVFTPGSGRVRRIARLPAPTTHAAAASLGGVAYVIGGRGAARNTPTARIVSVDLSSGRVRNAGVLPTPTSDLAAVTLSGKVLVAGGRTREGTTGTLFLLLPKAVSRAGRPSPRALNARTAVVNVYAFDRANMLSRPARSAVQRIYVPNSRSGTVDEIDPRTYRVVRHFAVGALPQHIVPGYHLKTLYVTNDLGNSLTPIDPRTGKPGRPIPVDDPYNMYFTPDGRYAIVVAERLHRLDFRNLSSFRLHRSLPVPCAGVDHLDFSADNRYLIASCEFSGRLLKIDVRRERVVAVLDLPDGRGGMPQDVKLSPDGRVFYVADLRANGLWEIDGNRLRVIGFLRTGIGVHGLYPSRDARFLYATNRGEGSISVISFRTRRVVTKWRIPGGGSPDMGGVSADGKVLWVSGRYSGVVYAISTRTGKLLARIPVGSGPHGLCVWPQPGRYSLGHTGELR